MAVFGPFYQQVLASRARSRLRRSGAAIAAFGLACICIPAAQAANFTCSWNDATANWTTVADWSNCNSTFPNNTGGNTYDVTLGQGIPTLASISTLPTGITAGNVTITTPGIWSITGTGAATLTGNLANSGALDVNTGSGDGGGSLTVDGMLTNALNNTSGAVQLGNVAVNAEGNRTYGLTAPASLTLGGLSNPSGASFQIIGSPSNQATLAFSSGGSGFISNAGDFELTYAAPLSLPGSVSNSGTFGVHNNTAVTIGGGFTNSGTLGVDDAITQFGNGITYSEGGSSLTIGGTLNNTNAVQVGSVVVFGEGNRTYGLTAPTSLTLGGLSNPSGASFQIIGSPSNQATLAFSSGGSGFISNAGDFELTYAAPLSLGASFTNSGTFGVHNNTAVTIGGGFTNSGTLGVDDAITQFGNGITYSEGGSSLTIGGTLNNTNAVQVGSVVVFGEGNRTYGLTAPTSLTLGGLSNPSGASFVLEGSPSHAATLAFSAGGAGFTSNGGDFELTYAAPLSLPGSFSNSGTFGVHNNTAVTIGGGFANSGTLGVDDAITQFGNGITYSEGGSSLTISGTLNNTNAVQVGSVVVFGEGNRTYGLTAPTSLTLGGLSNPSGASFQIIGSPSNQATLAFSSGGSGFIGNGGDFELTYAAPLSLPGSFGNSGTFGVHNNTAVTIGGGFANSGTLGVDDAITQFGNGITYSEGGSSLTIGGTLNNTNAVQVGSVVVFGEGNRTYGLTAPTSLTLGGLSNPSGASFVLEGSPSHAATLAFSAGGAGFTSNGGDFELTYAAPLSLPGSFSNSGTFGVHNNTAVTIGGGFANSGTLGVDDAITQFGNGITYSEGGSSLTIGGTLNNTNAVQVGSVVVFGEGNRTYGLTAPTSLTLGGLSNPSGASFVLEGSPSHAATLAFSAGGAGFTSNGGDFELTYAAPLSLPGSFSNSGTFGVHNNTAVTIGGGFANSGTLGVDDAITQFGNGITYSEGGSSLTIGGTLNNTNAVQVGSVVVFGEGNRTYGLTAPTSLTLGGLSNPSGASFQIIGSPSNQATLAFSSSGSGFTSNAGDFELTYAAPLSLGASFTNSGTFGVHNNTAVTIGGGFANSGTLAVDNAITQFGNGITYSEGGSSVAIGGTLNNTNAVQVGSVVVFGNGSRLYGLTAPTTLTLGGLTNTTTGTMGLFGNPINQATLSITAGTAANSGDLELHNHTVLSTASGVNLTNSGTLNIDTVAFTGGGEGGSTATVGGALSNTAIFNIGNTSLSAPTTVAAAGLTNTGTVNLLGNTTAGSTNQATVTVNGVASNSGTVNLPTATNVTVTGAGNAYTQTAGFTNLSGGTLAAPNVNITGGALQGLGTVNGAVSIGGAGIIQAINLANNALPATLTINGNYAQSGGTFNELLHGTGTQIDVVSVGNGDSVNLTGGNLQVSGVTFALGQMFNDIMTFQPGDLTGTFATLQGGGNGNMVNLGGGLTLEALYNNAQGNISLKVIPTVVSNTITWNDATGNWTTDTTKWTPTGPPVATNDVVIGSTNNGNVTLNNSTTVNSLTINPSNALTNTSGTTLTVTTTVGNSGSLTLGGNLSATGAVTNNSGATLAMQGGTLSSASLTNAGTTSGFGTINPLIGNSGLVQATGGTLTAQNGIQGTGNLTVDASSTLDLSHATAASSAGSLNVNGALSLGSQNLVVASGYNNANFGTGNSFDKRANVTGTGEIQAAGNVAQAVTGSQVTNGTSATPTLALGNVHVNNSTSASYSVANIGTSGPSLIGAIQTNVNGGNITDPALSGSGVTAQNFGPIATGTSTSPFTVTYAPTAAGALSGQAVHLANNFGNVGEQTLNITGAAYNLASSSTIGAINFGVLHVGAPTATIALSITNTAPAGGFSEGLDSSFGSYANNGGTLTPGFAGAITNLLAGSTDSTSMVASLGTATAGTVNGMITVHQDSNGTISGLANTPLPDQTPAVTGSVVTATITNLAVPQINNPQPITFAARTGTTVGTQGVSITNAAPASTFTEGLIGNVTGTTGTGITATGGFGPPTANPELGGQQTNSTFIQVGIDTSTAGVKSGNAEIDFGSDGTPFGGVVTDLGTTNVAVSGNVYTPAVANVLTTSPIDFGIVHVGDPTQTKSVTVQNGATATALNDGLVGTISAGGPPFSGSGSIAAPGLAPGASSSALQVNLATDTAGIFTGTANLALASHDAELADLPLSTSPLSLNAQVNLFAALGFLQQGGQGSLSGGGTSFDLDFGNVLQGSSQEAMLAILNDNPLADQAFTDLLSTDGNGSMGPFSLAGCSATKLPGGQSQGGCDASFDTSDLGDFSDVFSFPIESSNSSGYDQVIGDVTLTIEGDVTSAIPTPEPGTLTLLSSGLGMLFFVVRRRRRMA